MLLFVFRTHYMCLEYAKQSTRRGVILAYLYGSTVLTRKSRTHIYKISRMYVYMHLRMMVSVTFI